MKWIVRLLILLVLLVVAGVLVFQYVMKNRLTEIINTRLAASIEKNTGLSLEVGNASVDLFGGSIDLSDLTLRNAKGFQEPYLLRLGSLDLDVSLADLLKSRVITIPMFAVKQAELTIELGKDRRINLKAVHDRLKRSAATAAPPPSPSPAPGSEKPPDKTDQAPVQLPKVNLVRGEIEAIVHYVDYAHPRKGQPLRVDLAETITLSNLKLGQDGRQWAEINIKGGLKGKVNVCATTITGKISPIQDPVGFSMDLKGEIANLSRELIDEYLSGQDFTVKKLGLRMALKTRKGVFDPKQSYVALAMEGVKLSEKMAKKMFGGIDSFDQLTVPIHISGTLAQPETEDFFTALIHAALINIKANPQLQKILKDQILKALGQGKAAGDGKGASQREDTGKEGIKILGDALKGLLK